MKIKKGTFLCWDMWTEVFQFVTDKVLHSLLKVNKRFQGFLMGEFYVKQRIENIIFKPRSDDIINLKDGLIEIRKIYESVVQRFKEETSSPFYPLHVWSRSKWMQLYYYLFSLKKNYNVNVEKKEGKKIFHTCVFCLAPCTTQYGKFLVGMFYPVEEVEGEEEEENEKEEGKNEKEEGKNEKETEEKKKTNSIDRSYFEDFYCDWCFFERFRISKDLCTKFLMTQNELLRLPCVSYLDIKYWSVSMVKEISDDIELTYRKWKQKFYCNNKVWAKSDNEKVVMNLFAEKMKLRFDSDISDKWINEFLSGMALVLVNQIKIPYRMNLQRMKEMIDLKIAILKTVVDKYLMLNKIIQEYVISNDFCLSRKVLERVRSKAVEEVVLQPTHISRRKFKNFIDLTVFSAIKIEAVCEFLSSLSDKKLPVSEEILLETLKCERYYDVNDVLIVMNSNFRFKIAEKIVTREERLILYLSKEFEYNYEICVGYCKEIIRNYLLSGKEYDHYDTVIYNIQKKLSDENEKLKKCVGKKKNRQEFNNYCGALSIEEKKNILSEEIKTLCENGLNQLFVCLIKNNLSSLKSVNQSFRTESFGEELNSYFSSQPIHGERSNLVCLCEEDQKKVILGEIMFCICFKSFNFSFHGLGKCCRCDRLFCDNFCGKIIMCGDDNKMICKICALEENCLFNCGDSLWRLDGKDIDFCVNYEEGCRNSDRFFHLDCSKFKIDQLGKDYVVFCSNRCQRQYE